MTQPASQPGGFLRPGLPFTRCAHCHLLVSLRQDGRAFRHEGIPTSRKGGTCKGSGVQIRTAAAMAKRSNAKPEDDEWEVDVEALAAEAEQGYWCREPVGGGRMCEALGKPTNLAPGLHRPVLCEPHGQGWGHDVFAR